MDNDVKRAQFKTDDLVEAPVGIMIVIGLFSVILDNEIDKKPVDFKYTCAFMNKSGRPHATMRHRFFLESQLKSFPK